jgi:hypothetical protein
LPPNLVQEDFDAIGRLNGGREPPPVSAATCKNPYVDGQTPLPGEPAVVGQAPGVPGGGAPVAKGAAGTSGVSNGTGAGHNGAGGIAGTAGGVESAAAAGTSGGTTASTSGTTAGSFEKVAPGPNKYLRADGLASAATNLLDGLSPGMDVALWCGVLAVVLGAPPLISLGWRRRRRRAAIAASTTPIRNG